MAAGQGGTFKERHFTAEVILWALRWHLAYPISYRDLAAMLSDRGVSVDHATLFRWVQACAATLELRVRRHLPHTLVVIHFYTAVSLPPGG